MRMKSAFPARKVMASTLAAAITTVAVFAYEKLAGTGGVLPSNIVAAVQVIVVFLVGYFVPPSPNDTIVEIEEIVAS